MWKLALATGLALLHASDDRPRAQAQAFAREFYAWYIVQGDGGPELKGVDEALRTKPSVLASALAEALVRDRSGDESRLDFDPFTGGQDVAYKYELEEAVAAKDGYRVGLRAYWGDEDNPRRSVDAVAEIACAPECRFVDFHYRDGRRLTGIVAMPNAGMSMRP